MDEFLRRKLLSYLKEEKERNRVIKARYLGGSDSSYYEIINNAVIASLEEINKKINDYSEVINICIKYFEEGENDTVTLFTLFKPFSNILAESPFNAKQRMQILLHLIDSNIKKISLGADAPIVVVDFDDERIKSLTKDDVAYLTRIADPLSIDLNEVEDETLRQKFSELKMLFESAIGKSTVDFKNLMLTFKHHYFSKCGMIEREDIEIIKDALTKLSVDKELIQSCDYVLTNHVATPEESISKFKKYAEVYYQNQLNLLNLYLYYYDEEYTDNFEEDKETLKQNLFSVKHIIDCLNDLDKLKKHSIFKEFRALDELLDKSNLSAIDKYNVIVEVLKYCAKVGKLFDKSHLSELDRDYLYMCELLDEQYVSSKNIDEQDIRIVMKLLSIIGIHDSTIDEIEPLFKTKKEEVKEQETKEEKVEINYKELRKRLYELYNPKDGSPTRDLTSEEVDECIDLLYTLEYNKNEIKRFIIRAVWDQLRVNPNYLVEKQEACDPLKEYEALKDIINEHKYESDVMAASIEIEYCLNELQSDSIDEEMYDYIIDEIKKNIFKILQVTRCEKREVIEAKYRLGIM